MREHSILAGAQRLRLEDGSELRLLSALEVLEARREAEELADTLGFSDKNSVRPRLTELKALRLVDVIDKRRARSGKKTSVWAALWEGEKV